MLASRGDENGARNSIIGLRIITWLRCALSDPFSHFIVLGACLAGAVHFVNVDNAIDSQTILVDRNHLITYMQYQGGMFDKAHFGDVLDKMPQDELQKLIRDYVREEALYREGKALQLDQGDYVARLRLIQQLKFVIQGFPDDEGSLTESDIRAYFDAHKADYYAEPTITFAHVFISRDLHGRGTKPLAEKTLRALNARHVPFTEAMQYGDRFYYQVNYVHAKADLVSSHFESAMQERLFALKPSNHWVGPFESPYGYHLVMVTDHINGYLPSLSEIRNRVALDAFQAREKMRLDRAIENIVKNYKSHVLSIRSSKNGSTL